MKTYYLDIELRPSGPGKTHVIHATVEGKTTSEALSHAEHWIAGLRCNTHIQGTVTSIAEAKRRGTEYTPLMDFTGFTI